MRGWVRAGMGVALAFVWPAFTQGASTASITANGGQTYQVMEGFGANINHRSWSNDELKPALTALMDDLGLTLFRVIFDNADWETTNDNADPAVMSWSYYNSVYASADFEKLWAMAAYLNGKGVTNGLIFNFQGTGPSWMRTGDYLTAGYESEWAEMICSLLVYARSNRNVRFTTVGPGNEEDIPVQGIDMTASQYTTALHKLSQLLDTNGLSDVRLIGPDLANTSTSWLSTMMTDPLVMGKLAHFGLHSYYDTGGGSSGVDAFLKASAYPNRTFWMTEYNVWCTPCESNQNGDDSWTYAKGSARYLLYHLSNGAAAALIWEGYDSQYNYFSPPGLWSYWGLLKVDDINAATKTYSPRKTYYTTAQFTKFVRPGAERIQVSGSVGPLLLLGFYHPDTAQVTLVGVNTGTSATTLSATLTNLPSVGTVELYYTDSAYNLRPGATIPLTNNALSTTIPADCVFTLTGFAASSVAVSVAITNPASNAQFSAPATIPIQASATTTTGSVSSVTFFCGATNLGTAWSPPYQLTWSNVAPGNYALTAWATNSVGHYRVSPEVQVWVVGPLAQIRVTPTNSVLLAYGSKQFTASAADAQGVVFDPQPAFAWSASGGGTVDPSGRFTADGNAGGPFHVNASSGGVTNWALVTISTNFNLAPEGVGYVWSSLTASTGNSPRSPAAGINDGDTNTDVSLFSGGGQDISNAYEAAGVVWPEEHSIVRVVYRNGSYDAHRDGVFAAAFGLQFSPDGVTWTNAGAAWTLSPAYVYNSATSANTAFTFTGGKANVRGVRCVGRVHTSSSTTTSWVAYAREVETYVEPPLPPVVLAAAGLSNGVAISWPAVLTNYSLEANPLPVTSNSWVPVTNAPQVMGDRRVVTLPPTNASQFFRLHQQ